MVYFENIENQHIRYILDNIRTQFLTVHGEEVHKSQKALHFFMNQEQGALRENLDKLRHDKFISGIFDDKPYVFNVDAMDEIYYFKPGFKGVAKVNGIDKHKDGIYRLPSDKSLYRVLITLTVNNDTQTCFEDNIKSKCYTMTKYDLLSFDYNHDLHYVKEVKGSTTERILLKLHYITSNTPDVVFYKRFHEWYAEWTRQNMELAQDLESKTDKSWSDRVYLWLVLNSGWLNIFFYQILVCIICIAVIGAFACVYFYRKQKRSLKRLFKNI